MKKVGLWFVLLLALGYEAPCRAQNVDKFLDEFNAFVYRFEKNDSITLEQFTVYNTEFNEYTRQYGEVYKPLMNSGQVGRYAESKGRYEKTLAQFHAGRIAGKADSLATDVEKTIQKKGAEFTGFIKGWLKKEKEE